ncbi:MAG: family hydrolase [Herbinix sp.]|jgi:histidine triad (HIT) family protein|nr:family hydrolase [Herbinix sp.]
MEDCIFCGIIHNKIPSMKIYEDEFTYAFLDIAMDVDGHTIVVPKRHTVNILDCDNETLGHLMNTVKLISNYYVDKCGYSGVNLLNASGTSAQQSISHFHIHIIPRTEDDGVDAWPNFIGSQTSLEEMYNKLLIK